MDQVLLIAIIIAAVAVANIIERHVPMVPLPFFLILLGLGLDAVPIYHNFHLESSVFAFAIIAPLLFNDAQNTSRFWISRSVANILSLTVGLILFTTLVIGFFLHLWFAVLPLSLSFALMAIVGPTDPAAVKSIFESNPIDGESSGILQHESLFNDATGIVLFDLALATYITGTFSFGEAIGMFLWEFVGGLLFGALLGFIIVSIRLFLIRQHDDTPLIMVLIQLLTPFLIYLLADELHMSGIIAVVAAGLVQGSERDKLRLTSSRMQLVTSNVWEVLSGTLSGVVFVLLGVALPDVTLAMQDSKLGIMPLVGIGILIYLAKTLIRMVWSRYLLKRRVPTKTPWRDSLVLALSGPNGTITLALAFSLPLTIAGHEFALRGPIIFLAAVIIITSLILPTIFVPMLLPAKALSKPHYRWVKRMIQAAIADLSKEKDHEVEAQVVMDTLQEQLVLDSTPNLRIQRHIMREAHAVEIKATEAMHAAGKITDNELKYYKQFMQLNHFSSDDKLWKNLVLRIRFSFHMGAMYRNLSTAQEAFLTTPILLEEIYWRDQFEKHGEDILPIEAAGFESVMTFLKDENSSSGVEANMVKRFYRRRHRRIHGHDVDMEIVYQMFMRAFHTEYELIQTSLQSGKITSALAEKLQQRVTVDEMTYLQNVSAYGG